MRISNLVFTTSLQPEIANGDIFEFNGNESNVDFHNEAFMATGSFSVVLSGHKAVVSLSMKVLQTSGNVRIQVSEPTATLEAFDMHYMDGVKGNLDVILSEQGRSNDRCSQAPPLMEFESVRHISGSLTLKGCFNDVTFPKLTYIQGDVIIDGTHGNITVGSELHELRSMRSLTVSGNAQVTIHGNHTQCVSPIQRLDIATKATVFLHNIGRVTMLARPVRVNSTLTSDPSVIHCPAIITAASQSDPTAAPRDSVPDIDPAGQAPKKQTKGARIAEIVIGVGLAVALLAGTAVLICERRKLHIDIELKEQLLTNLSDDVAQLQDGWRVQHDEIELVKRIDGESPGAFGEVYMANWGELQVCVKVLKTGVMMMDEITIEEFQVLLFSRCRCLCHLCWHTLTSLDRFLSQVFSQVVTARSIACNDP
eukprot:TRINITY_DN11034_c0_g1_i2.p1 TRINITY_DN11034_c0_g1~~TRINITY_DN11034_c0_g1_i2.p1  ORF type:complete len:424 (+),score=91.30 TRINITY_DN11034_c0_g1_i2:814-2085(+)